MSIEKILVVGLCGIGDLLFFLPALKGLRENFPDAKIDALLFPGPFKQLFEGTKSFDSQIEFPVQKWGLSQGGGLKTMAEQKKVLSQIRKQNYDLAIWPFAHTTFKKRVLTHLIGAKKSLMHKGRSYFSSRSLGKQDRLIQYRFDSHAVERNLDLVATLGIFADKVPIDIGLSKEEVQTGKKELEFLVGPNKKVFGFHPGGNIKFNQSRQWSPQKFAHLADEVSAKFNGVSVFFGSGQPDEIKMLEGIQKNMKSESHLMCGKHLRLVASVMRNLDLFVGNDSSLVHLASTQNIPIVAIHGPTNFRITGPWGEQTHSVRLDLPCSPCYDTGFSAECSHRMCLAHLEVAHLTSVVEKILETDDKKASFLPKEKKFMDNQNPDENWDDFMLKRKRWQEQYERQSRYASPEVVLTGK